MGLRPSFPATTPTVHVTGAGEGNRTLVFSLGSLITILGFPHFNKRLYRMMVLFCRYLVGVELFLRLRV